MFYRALGLMSGTSLDGLDIAYCEFDIVDQTINYAIKKATTIVYSKDLRDKIIACENSSAEEFCQFSSFLGHYFGRQAFSFLKDNNLDVDFIASHGQTIFHQPDKGFTTQIGDLSAIAYQTKHKVVGDFRSLDVALGGQGAPLVPLGDKLLFADFESCVNIGGFSNISFDKNNKRIAFDICPSNMILNYLSSFLGKDYDKDGCLASEGAVDFDLLEKLDNIEYYKQKKKYSLSKEWTKKYVFPIIDNYITNDNKDRSSIVNALATYTEHIANQIAKVLQGRTLLTGGGAKNTLLTNKIKQKTNYEIVIPDNTLIDYKEALIFAFLGLRRLREETNCLASVTGAKKDSCCGAVIQWNNN